VRWRGRSRLPGPPRERFVSPSPRSGRPWPSSMGTWPWPSRGYRPRAWSRSRGSARTRAVPCSFRNHPRGLSIVLAMARASRPEAPSWTGPPFAHCPRSRHASTARRSWSRWP